MHIYILSGTPYFRGFKGNFLSCYENTLGFFLSLLLDVH